MTRVDAENQIPDARCRSSSARLFEGSPSLGTDKLFWAQTRPMQAQQLPSSPQRPQFSGTVWQTQHPARRKDAKLNLLLLYPRQPSHGVRTGAALTLTDQSPEPRAVKLSRHWRRAQASAFLANSLPAPTISIPALVPVKEVKTSETEEEILLPLPRDVENLADDPQLHNPLQRSERMSTGWFGVVMEYDGVVVEDTSDLQRKAWLRTAEEEGRPAPPQFALRRSEGMKNDQVIKEVLCWTREPMEVRRIAEHKEAVLTEMLGDMQPMLVSHVSNFMDSLSRNKVPAALATSAPEARVKPALKALGLDASFVGVVAAEDTYRGRPDPEPYLLASQMLGRPPARCIVIGNSNQTVEAARECGMASVVVAGRKPLYELKAADLVVKHLSELRVVNLKQLFRNEDLVAANEEGSPEPELEEEDSFEDTSLW